MEIKEPAPHGCHSNSKGRGLVWEKEPVHRPNMEKLENRLGQKNLGRQVEKNTFVSIKRYLN